MASPVVPISELGYLLRQDSGFDMAEPDRPLSAQLIRHEVGGMLGHVWDSQAQFKGSACFISTALETWTSSDVAAKSGNDAYTWLRTIDFPVRLCPDGRPEPIRVMVAGETSGSNIWIRGILRWQYEDPPLPWPLGRYRDGWQAGQATFSSATSSWKELDSVVSATEQYGILQFTPGQARLAERRLFEREGGHDMSDRDFEPTDVVLASIDFWGGFVSGTSGTGSFTGYLIRGCAYGLKDSDAT